MNFIKFILNKLAAKVLFGIFCYMFFQPVPNQPYLTLWYQFICIASNIFLGVYLLDQYPKVWQITTKHWYRLVSIGLFAWFIYALFFKDWNTYHSVFYVFIDTLFLCTDSYIMQYVFGWFKWISKPESDNWFSLFKSV